MANWFLEYLSDPGIRSRLLHDEGEFVVDDVHHHWVVYWSTVLEYVLAVILLGIYIDSSRDAWPLAWIAFGLLIHGTWLALGHFLDRFVITNFRVFRLTGVFSRDLATMPIDRILDITVKQPAIGRLLGYGHFTFETAAQEQGLRDIRYVGHPQERDLIIQRIVQRAGVRRRAV
jgi:uncharacterized membrane protein YdbT with pleckstrin-like domain